MAQQSGFLEGVKRRDHAPFGEELQASRNESRGYLTANIRQGFTGYEKDAETGLNYAKARFQNSILGRFISVDPYLGSSVLAQPQSWNHYAYCVNNPMMYADPSGLLYLVKKLPSGKNLIEYFPDNQLEKYADEIKRLKELGYEEVEDGYIIDKLTNVEGSLAGFSYLLGVRVGLSTNPDGSPLILPAPRVPVSAPSTATNSYGDGCLNCHDFIRAVAQQTAPIPRAVAAFEGVSVVGGVGVYLSGAVAAEGLTTLNLGTEGETLLFRGVARAHPGFKDALNGIARSRGGTATPAQHNLGNTLSDFTSWTYDRAVAAEFADADGVVLQRFFSPSQIIESPDIFEESEVLIRGVVEGSTATLP